MTAYHNDPSRLNAKSPVRRVVESAALSELVVGTTGTVLVLSGTAGEEGPRKVTAAPEALQ